MRHRRELEKWLKQYQLAIEDITEQDLRSCYMQQRPNNPFDSLLCKEDGAIDSSMPNSPHYELAELYIRRGDAKARKHFHSTRYYQMAKIIGRRSFPSKMEYLVRSLRKGYLRRKFKWDYIVALRTPFARSRYKRDVPILVPEIWSGHHRVGILLAMKKHVVPVVFAKDLKPGSCRSAGKVHGLCKDLS